MNAKNSFIPSMALYFLTGSKNKFAEIKAVLPQVEQLERDLTEIQELDPHKIIAAKLFEARTHHGNSFMVEDTSLYLDALNGLPGPLIKWFMKTVGNDGLYKMAQAFGNFGAEAKTIIGYVDEKGKIEFFEGSIRGTIVEPRGTSDFGWDPIFMPEGQQKTFAEMSPGEKGKISHRGAAIRKLKEALSSTF